MGLAMVAASRDLAALAGPHSLVVVTGGADTCNAEAGQLIADEAERAGIELKVFVVGYQVPPEEAEAIKGWIDEGGGQGWIYAGADNVESLKAILTAIQRYVDRGSDEALDAVIASVTEAAATSVALAPTSASTGESAAGTPGEAATTEPPPASETPAPTVTETPTLTPTATGTPTATPTPTRTPTATYVIAGSHTVQINENLLCIARAYGVFPDAIGVANRLAPPYPLVASQVLLIPAVRWPNPLPGPVCAAQFTSPFPAVLPPAPSPTNTLPPPPPTDTQPPPPPPTDTQPPPSDTAGPEIGSTTLNPAGGCSVSFQAALSDQSGVSAAVVTWTALSRDRQVVHGTGSLGLQLARAPIWLTSNVDMPAGTFWVDWTVTAYDLFQNASSASGSVMITSCF
jgi:hypothetical protein